MWACASRPKQTKCSKTHLSVVQLGRVTRRTEIIHIIPSIELDQFLDVEVIFRDNIYIQKLNSRYAGKSLRKYFPCSDQFCFDLFIGPSRR